MASKVYGNALKAAFNKEVDFDSDTIKVMLLSSAYTPNQDTHDYLDDVVGNEVTGTGYTAGGAALASKTVTYDAATNTLKFDAADVTWASSSITARYAVVYDDTPATNATKPLLAYFDFTTDRASSNGDFIVRWGTDGIFSATAA
jgi:hypothetical protein